jgi:hypothetical protein
MGRFVGYHLAMIGRGLAASVIVAIALALISEACGAPAIGPLSAANPTPILTDVQATAVRRTAIAVVQRVIANPPVATATLEATAIPRPGCAGAIWWHEARLHVGENRTVQGAVVATRTLADGTAMLEVGQPYPDPTGLVVVISGATDQPTENAAEALTGKSVCVVGRITSPEGRTAIVVRDLSSVTAAN